MRALARACAEHGGRSTKPHSVQWTQWSAPARRTATALQARQGK